MNYWLFKSEPSVFSFEALKAKGKAGTQWDGVRNYAARNNMKAMQIGDLGFFYHSNEGLNVVGIAEVCALAHPDSTTDDPRWECVDIRAVKDVPNPPTLEQVKANPEARRDGAGPARAAFRAAGDAGRMEGSLPHGRPDARSVTALTPNSAKRFILDNTALMAPPHVPEILLHLADEAHDLWQRTEDELAEIGLPPPFWAFAWAGGQGLARYVLDNPATVRGKRVLDFASGSGLVAIAAAKAGAAEVIAADIDPFCETAIRLNAEANGVEIEFCGTDCIGTDAGWDVVLAGDVFYDKSFADTADAMVRDAEGARRGHTRRRSRPLLSAEGGTGAARPSTKCR